MWLPTKDERETLRKYHSSIHNIGELVCFTDISERAYNATRKLIERGLILDVTKGEEGFVARQVQGENIVSLKDFLSFSEEDETKQEAVLKFTLKGLDLAYKYNNCLIRSCLWFAEYKDHWFWLILGFLGGIIGALIVNWLSK